MTTVVYEENDNVEESIKSFFEMIKNQGASCQTIAKKLAEVSGVSYLEEKESDETEDRKNWPTSFNAPLEAMNKIKKLAGAYYHFPSMNVVLVDASGEQVGIRSIDMTIFGIVKPVVRDLLEWGKNNAKNL